MDHKHLEQIGETLRSLGHDRRQLVERIIAVEDGGNAPELGRLYRELDRISERAMNLMEEQRALVAREIADEIGL